MFYIWLVISIALAILEMATVNLVSIWFVISGLLAMVGSLFIKSIIVQIAIFAIGGLILMILTKDLAKKIMPVHTKTNFDRIIGMNGIVIEKITKNTPGEVKVDGKNWTAIANKTIEKDSIVKILEINSTKLKVEKVED